MQHDLNKLHGIDNIVKYMQNLLSAITVDLDKSTKGNKAASQRVRTGTVKLEKVAKLYRKESIKSEKGQTKSKAKRKAAPAKKPAAKSTAKKPAAKAPAKKAAHGHDKHHANDKHKAHTKKATVKPKALAVKRPTAKLPSRGR